jgi:hypothetical protein
MLEESGMRFEAGLGAGATPKQGLKDGGGAVAHQYAASLGPLGGSPSTKTILRRINLFHVFREGARMNVYSFMNPKITNLELDELDMADNGGGNEVSLQFVYDSVNIQTNCDVLNKSTFDLTDLSTGAAGDAMYPLNPIVGGGEDTKRKDLNVAVCDDEVAASRRTTGAELNNAAGGSTAATEAGINPAAGVGPLGQATPGADVEPVVDLANDTDGDGIVSFNEADAARRSERQAQLKAAAREQELNGQQIDPSTGLFIDPVTGNLTPTPYRSKSAPADSKAELQEIANANSLRGSRGRNDADKYDREADFFEQKANNPETPPESASAAAAAAQEWRDKATTTRTTADETLILARDQDVRAKEVTSTTKTVESTTSSGQIRAST